LGDLKIIRLPPEQWQRYREIRLEALRREPQAFGTTSAEAEGQPPEYWQGRLSAAQGEEDSWLYFAQDGEQLIGMIGAFYDPELEAAEIVSVYVSQAARGQGAGKALMEAILSAVKKKEGLQKAILGVNREQAAAVRLYRDFGFTIVKEKEGMQGDGNIYIGYLMEKEL
jgi:ribosomal protein S18 acetylase RimI-like enzyme